MAFKSDKQRKGFFANQGVGNSQSLSPSMKAQLVKKGLKSGNLKIGKVKTVNAKFKKIIQDKEFRKALEKNQLTTWKGTPIQSLLKTLHPAFLLANVLGAANRDFFSTKLQRETAKKFINQFNRDQFDNISLKDGSKITSQDRRLLKVVRTDFNLKPKLKKVKTDKFGLRPI